MVRSGKVSALIAKGGHEKGKGTEECKGRSSGSKEKRKGKDGSSGNKGMRVGFGETGDSVHRETVGLSGLKPQYNRPFKGHGETLRHFGTDQI